MPDLRNQELRIQLDPLNPGQFYACCGLLELAGLDCPDVLSRFELEPGRPRVSWFCVDSNAPADFLPKILDQLRAAKVSFSRDFEPSISPAKISFAQHEIELDWWLNEFRDKDKPAPVKCWAGQVTTRGLLTELLALLDRSSSGSDLFHTSQLTKSKFAVDPRAAWNARDCGYSPNAHGTDSATFTAVEVLAAIGNANLPARGSAQE